jgi:hypothetical protein
LFNAGFPNIERIDSAMESEHTKRHGFDKSFTTANYNITTTPKREWDYVVHRCKFESEVREVETDGRSIPDIGHLMETDDTVKRSELSKNEVISVVLFTGPMVHPIPRS